MHRVFSMSSMPTQRIFFGTMLDLGGQPGTVDISSEKNYIAIAIENERGLIPNLPVVFLPSMSRSTPQQHFCWCDITRELDEHHLYIITTWHL
jgi:hypothetical protein